MSNGFSEQQSPFAAFDPNPLVGVTRSMGPDGPTYEVLHILDTTRARICVLETEREVDYDIADILTDPGPDAT